MERIDLHTHTLASDGSDTPAAVAQQAAYVAARVDDLVDVLRAHRQEDADILLLHFVGL